MALVPMMLLVFLLCELHSVRRPGTSPGFTIIATMMYLPIISQAIANANHFFSRIRTKNGSDTELPSMYTVTNAIQNYPKYFRIDFLFVHRENGDDLARILRHSISDSGWVFLPLALACTIRLASEKSRYPRRWAIPFIVLMLLSPLPDLVTTSPDKPPYSFALGMSLFCIPFVACAGMADCAFYLQRFLGRSVRILCPLVTVAVLQAAVVLFATLPVYPWHASNYWGWQYGMEPIIGYYEEHRDEFTSLQVDPWFNRPKTLAIYYLEDDQLLETISFEKTPPLGSYDPTMLVAVSEEYAAPSSYEEHSWQILETFYYPNGEAAWHMMTPP